MKKYYDLLKKARLSYIELTPGIYLMTKENAVDDFRSFDDEDQAREKYDESFFCTKYVIQITGDNHYYELINNAKELKEFMKDL